MGASDKNSMAEKAAALWPFVLSLCVALIFCGVAATMLLDMRQSALKQAEDSAQNLVNVIEQDISRNVEMIDLSLGSVVDGLAEPEVRTMRPDLRQLVLFDRVATAKSLGALVSFDEKGVLTYDSAGVPPRQIAPVSDRDYFQAQIERDVGLYVSAPYVSRLLGKEVVGFSRRVTNPDGSFGGVALGTIQISYFSDLFRRLEVGKGGVVSLVRTDGTVLAREPVPSAGVTRSVAGSAAFQRMLAVGSGRFVSHSGIDKTERLYTVRHLPGLPLIVSVGLAVEDIYAEWWTKALTLGFIVFAICLATVSMTWMLVRELHRRGTAEQMLRTANSELARLSITDPLTGLANRRKFDDVLEIETKRAHRVGRPLALLVIDADRFKNYNDRYGHGAGDTALKAIALCLTTAAKRPSDLPCRIGGEEFALVLPDTPLNGARAVAEELRSGVLRLMLPHAGNDTGLVSISVGVASLGGKQDAVQLFAQADGALYAAKGEGRNRVCVAGEPKTYPVKAA